MRDIVGLIVLIAIAVLLIWLAFRVCRVRHSMLKWSGVVLAAVLAVAVSSVSALTITGMVKEHVRRAPIPDLNIETTPERIARGKAVVDGFCSGCHSKTGTLTGGFDIGEDFPLHVGSFISSNLTPVGPLKHWTDGEIFRAIRNGVDANGRWLTIMSYTNASRLSDEDTKAVIAYIRSVPAAGTQTPDPPDRFRLLGVGDAGRRHAAKRQADRHV
jgi:mono/diheme cytochrome c family protein